MNSVSEYVGQVAKNRNIKSVNISTSETRGAIYGCPSTKNDLVDLLRKFGYTVNIAEIDMVESVGARCVFLGIDKIHNKPYYISWFSVNTGEFASRPLFETDDYDECSDFFEITSAVMKHSHNKTLQLLFGSE